jgi:hypothetical protein
MSCDLWNCFLKIQKSIGTPTPKVGVHLGVCGFIPSHPPTHLGAWNVKPGLHFQPTPLQALALVMNLRLRLWQLPCPLSYVIIWHYDGYVWMYKTNVTWSGSHVEQIGTPTSNNILNFVMCYNWIQSIFIGIEFLQQLFCKLKASLWNNINSHD